MLHREICRALSYFFFGFAALLLIPLAIALYFEYGVNAADHPQPHSSWSFILTIAFTVMGGGLLSFYGRNGGAQLFWREGILLAVLIWVLAPALGALPFLFSGTLKKPIHAYFEAVSAFTTTGASVLQSKQYDSTTGEELKITTMLPTEPTVAYTYYGTVEPVRDPKSGLILRQGIEAVSQALLFWRAFMQWLGGIGIVVLFIAILPMLGVGGKALLNAEMPGPLKDMWTPRAKQTITELSKLYIGLTILMVLLLQAFNTQMGWIESLDITLATLSTGGFTPHEDSIATYNSPATEWLVIVFMLLGGINFSLYYYLLKGRLYRIRDPELLAFAALVVIGSLVMTYQLWNATRYNLEDRITGVYTLTEALRHGSFQWVSTLTTTGFFSADYDYWPLPTQLMMFLAMFLGGMSGSTAGGMKTIRLFIAFQVIKNRLESLFRPNAVKRLVISGKEIDSTVSIMVLSFLVTLTCVATVGWLLLVFNGCGIWFSLSAVTCCINNAGMALGITGPYHSFASLPDFSLGTCCVLMLLGRLEFFAILALLLPAFWRAKA